LALLGLVLKQRVDEGFQARDTLPEVLAMVNHDVRIGVLLIDATRSPSKTLGAYVGVVWRKDASYFTAAT
jgi:hypothetical protein